MTALEESISIGHAGGIEVFVRIYQGKWQVERYDGEYSSTDSVEAIRALAALLNAAADKAEELNR